jgi:hypothetical protein
MWSIRKAINQSGLYPLVERLREIATVFEGFWGAILEKDTTLSDLYQDWEE